VLAGVFPVAAAEILSKGVGPSTGVVIIDGDKAYYFTSNASDLESTLTTLIATIQKLVLTFTAFAGSMTGPTTAPPPTLAVDLAELTAKAAELTAIKELLK
jgi:hypothetical protein